MTRGLRVRFPGISHNPRSLQSLRSRAHGWVREIVRWITLQDRIQIRACHQNAQPRWLAHARPAPGLDQHARTDRMLTDT